VLGILELVAFRVRPHRADDPRDAQPEILQVGLVQLWERCVFHAPLGHSIVDGEILISGRLVLEREDPASVIPAQRLDLVQRRHVTDQVAADNGDPPHRSTPNAFGSTSPRRDGNHAAPAG
jgi:hypothetical protein